MVYSYWTEVEKIGSIDDLQQLENSVRQSLYQIRAHKNMLQHQQLMSSECKNQIQSEIDVDFGMDNEQQLENFSWVTDENMNVPLKQEDPNMHPADYYVSQILEASYRPQFGGNLASSETLTANLSRYRL
ncbi:hypothetical protein Bca52824_052556 [Brassica carinata]|uniref:Uncharacterized protein n=1 Tax=Brassica carinata TaxID=52824 RepID=A0A8X7R3Z6_BRACI|nr:hypothetical protein Bca52824_052556 [Brassica carinata]